jgi:ribonuclease J
MPETNLRVVPLGGLGDIGRNMMAVEYAGEIVVIDAGVLFPDEGMPAGVDFAIPNFSYLKENRQKLAAVLITHGHEDHIGALPYLLAEFDVPVYASRLTHGLITVKLREHGLIKDARLNVVEPYSPFKVGGFRCEFFRVCHSIPDAMGIALGTPLGHVVHMGDFKIDHTPADGRSTDFSALARLAAEGVVLLLSDSTYAEVEGYTESEQVVGEALDRAIGQAPGRVMIATFASLISRIQQVIDAAEKHGRKVAVVGRSMMNNVNMAKNMGYLQVRQGTLVPLNEARRLPLEETVIIATGSQGEPTSALVRIANGEHQDIEIVPGDTVVISASPIPGNESLVSNTIDNLFRQGASVLYSRVAMVHVHGHASREELKMVLSLVKPKFFVPVHGEYRHLVTHAALAQSMGVHPSNTFVLEDGDVLELDGEGGRVVGSVDSSRVLVVGRSIWAGEKRILDERKRLAREGIVTAVVTLSEQDGGLLKDPVLTSTGFLVLGDLQNLFEKTSKVVAASLDQDTLSLLELNQVKVRVTEAVSDYLFQETGRRPAVVAVVEHV